MCLIMTEDGWQQLGNAVVCSNHNKLEGVYRPSPLDRVLLELTGRRERFLEANGIQNMMDKQHHFRGDSFNEPLFGAFGEKL